MGLQLRQVDLDQLVIGGALVSHEVVLELVAQGSDVRAAGGGQVLGHALVVREHGGGGANLGTHVADGGHAGARHGLHTRAKVLHNGAGATLHREDARYLADDILGGGPIRHLAGQLNADHLGALQLPGQPSHDIHGVRAAHTDRAHAEATSVGGMGVRANHHAAGEGIVLQHDLVDDTRARLPEAHAVLGAGRGQEFVHLLVDVICKFQVSHTTKLAAAILLRGGGALDEMVAVDCGGHRCLGQAGRDELQHGHLRRRVLHGHTVRAQPQVAHSSLDVLVGRVVQVAVHNLLRECERTVQALLHHCQALVHKGVAVVEVVVGLKPTHGRLGHARHRRGHTPHAIAHTLHGGAPHSGSRHGACGAPVSD
mmetsp:Transcript_41547/g.106288  ORF Transcript_41547/g.106288 Transcript_41547/m.106288 type:complete len:369 (-) Transcript_41547:81-1187(-)